MIFPSTTTGIFFSPSTPLPSPPPHAFFLNQWRNKTEQTQKWKTKTKKNEIKMKIRKRKNRKRKSGQIWSFFLISNKNVGNVHLLRQRVFRSRVPRFSLSPWIGWLKEARTKRYSFVINHQHRWFYSMTWNWLPKEKGMPSLSFVLESIMVSKLDEMCLASFDRNFGWFLFPEIGNCFRSTVYRKFLIRWIINGRKLVQSSHLSFHRTFPAIFIPWMR